MNGRGVRGWGDKLYGPECRHGGGRAADLLLDRLLPGGELHLLLLTPLHPLPELLLLPLQLLLHLCGGWPRPAEFCGGGSEPGTELQSRCLGPRSAVQRNPTTHATTCTR
jgi:hypothetical protein